MEDPTYRNPFSRANSIMRHRGETGFDLGISFGGVVLLRDDPREKIEVETDPAPIAYAQDVQRMDANRALLDRRAYNLNQWAGADGIFIAYEAAATLLVLRRLGVEPEWSPGEQLNFDAWCAKHAAQVEDSVQRIE